MVHYNLTTTPTINDENDYHEIRVDYSFDDNYHDVSMIYKDNADYHEIRVVGERNKKAEPVSPGSSNMVRSALSRRCRTHNHHNDHRHVHHCYCHHHSNQHQKMNPSQ